jgi:alpha-galactosidase
MKSQQILTPLPGPAPRINGPKVFGVRPGSPFLFKIAATGEKPLHYACDPLPRGLQLDPDTGIITGLIPTESTFLIKLKVSNSHGTAQRDFRIECGEKICLTPPMGWNSWYVHSLWVSQEKIQAMAKAMVDSGLVDHGWTYINIDDGWQGQRDPATGALQPNSKFPNMKGMCDYVHSLGLKIGIYSTPWVGSYAGYIGGSSPNKQYDYSALEVGMDQRIEAHQLHGQDKNLRRRGRYFGEVPCDEADAKQWAAWGFDYLKYDWTPNDVPHVTTMETALRNSGRDMVYSLSNSAPFALAEEWVKHANLWRTTGDIRDIWLSICHIGFSQDKWAPYAGPGHWNDPDMLQVGYTATPHVETPQSRSTRLTPDEQYTQMSLWCLLSAPLLLSCNLTMLDEFTIGLLTNDEVLEINQDPLGIQATTIKSTFSIPGLIGTRVLAKKLEDGSMAVGLFNLGRFSCSVSIEWNRLGLEGMHSVRDLWRQKDLGEFSGKFSAKVAPHGVLLVKIK